VYPSDSEEEEDENDEENGPHEEPESMKAIMNKIEQLNLDLLEEKEKIDSAAYRLQICDHFGSTASDNHPAPSDLGSIIKAYTDERAKISVDRTRSIVAVRKVEEEIAKYEKEKVKLRSVLAKAHYKEHKEKTKLRMKKARKMAETRKERQRIKDERSSFWPKKVYRITISLEPTIQTPGSSRPSSIDGDTIVNLATTTFHNPSSEHLKAGEVSLSLSYITYSASWAPRYDLSLNSLKCTGVLEYGAELKNNTSETWRDAKVVLSTSQTTFSGLNESIPVLHPWHVRLVKGLTGTDGALFSKTELEAKRQQRIESTEVGQKPRHEIFGIENSRAPAWAASRHPYAEAAYDQASSSLFRREDRLPQPFGAQSNSNVQGSLLGSSGTWAQSNSNTQSSLFGSSGTCLQSNTNIQGGLFGSVTPATSAPIPVSGAVLMARRRVQPSDEAEESKEELAFVAAGDSDPDNSIVFEEGAWEESGLTTTYDVPGLKTLAPSNSTSKHKISKIDFKNIVFSHIVVGKLRQVAFLKARLCNASRITLLKGPLSLTLDGSFLGRSTFPRCSAGESFTLPLGVDPAIQIHYLKPTVRRSQSGIFSKEDSNTFMRTMVITNTKHNAPVELVALDQIPVSEDERLKIEITSPRGLKIDGESVCTGVGFKQTNLAQAPTGTTQSAKMSSYPSSARQESGPQGGWGKAEAMVKKNGEVTWNIKLKAGCGVRLCLEYEALFPAGEAVVN
jgi:hypothetical protein